VLTLPAALASCADPDSVLFVTTTAVGIDADTKPANLSIGYDRYEGYIGPVYGTGAIAPVVARLESNLSIFSPEIRQIYATGDAARIVTATRPSAPSDKPMFRDEKHLMFFGTGSQIGLKATFTANAPESVSFGYKRKEFSFIPLGKDVDPTSGRGVDRYGSVLAAIDMNVNTPSLSQSELGVSQFFATGIAAEQLARENEEIRKAFQTEAEQAVTLTTTKFVKDEAGDRLRRAIDEDPNFRATLAKWIKARGLEVSVTSFLRGDAYAEKRKKAVQELLPQ
jgi:hypothetical protein